MARGRSPGYEAQRAAILAGAARLFAQRGYPGTSMQQVADACALSKATFYHYYRDKDALLLGIAEGHVTRLAALAAEVAREAAAPEARLRALIARLVDEYAVARDAHRVLTEDVRFLADADRARVRDREREVVAVAAAAIAALRDEGAALRDAGAAGDGLDKPLAMLLFGMINWLFMWLRPDGALTHRAIAPIVADLFLGGLPAVRAAAPIAVAAVPDPVTPTRTA